MMQLIIRGKMIWYSLVSSKTVRMAVIGA